MKTNKTNNAKGNKNRRERKKEQYISGLYDKPAIELAEVGVPLTWKSAQTQMTMHKHW